MNNEKAITIRSVADGDKMELHFPGDSVGVFGLRSKAWGVSAARINKIDGWRHYRVAKFTEMRTIVIIAERRPDDGTDESRNDL